MAEPNPFAQFTTEPVVTPEPVLDPTADPESKTNPFADFVPPPPPPPEDEKIEDADPGLKMVAPGIFIRADRQLGDYITGAAEVAGTVLSSVVAEPVAGIAGLVGTALPGEAGQGEEYVQGTREAMTYQPRGETAQDQLQAVGSFLEPVGEALSSVETGMGEAALDATGSPFIASMAHTVPAALMELLGLGLLKKPSQAAARAAAAQERVRLSESMTPEQRANAVLEPEMRSHEVIAQDLRNDLDITTDVRPDAEIISAAEELGVELNPSHYSTSESYRRVEQAIKSQPKAKFLAAKEAEAIQQLGERADQMIGEFGGHMDRSLLDVRVRSQVESTIKDLDDQAEKLYGVVNNGTAVKRVKVEDPDAKRTPEPEIDLDAEAEAQGKAQRKRERTINSAIRKGEDAIFRNNSGNNFYTVHPSTKNPGELQVTVWDKNGPISDSQHKSIDEVSRHYGDEMRLRTDEAEFEAMRAGEPIKSVEDPDFLTKPVVPVNTEGAQFLKGMDTGNVRTGIPIKFHYLRSTEKAPQRGAEFGQDIEPAGQYINIRYDDKQLNPGMEAGVYELKNPMVIENPTGSTVDWKKQLSKEYGGLTGKELTKALKRDGYDGIITKDVGITDRGRKRQEGGEISESIIFNPKKATPRTYEDVGGTGIPKATKVNTRASRAYIDARLEELGGDASGLSKAEKMLHSVMNQKKAPTYARLDQLRRDVGAGFKQKGKFKDDLSGNLDQVYRALITDQQGIAESMGVGAEFAAARKLVETRKQLEKQAMGLFGKDINKSFLPKLTQAASGLTKGDIAQFKNLMEALPDNLRTPAAATLLNDLFTHGTRTGGSLGQGFARAYDALNRHAGAKAEIFKHLPPAARKRFDAIGKVSSGIFRAKALENTSRTARDILQALESGGMISQITDKASDTVLGRMTFVPGPTRWIASAAKASKSVAKKAFDRVTAADTLMSSNAFNDAIQMAAQGQVKQAETMLNRSQAWQRWRGFLGEGAARQLAAMGPIAFLTQQDEQRLQQRDPAEQQQQQVVPSGQ